MLVAEIFKDTKIKCADNYIMLSTYICGSEEVISIIEKYGAEEIILSPIKNIMRVTLRESLIDTNVISVERPTAAFLYQLWNLGVLHLNGAIRAYVKNSEIGVLGAAIWKDGQWKTSAKSEVEREWIDEVMGFDGVMN